MWRIEKKGLYKWKYGRRSLWWRDGGIWNENIEQLIMEKIKFGRRSLFKDENENFEQLIMGEIWCSTGEEMKWNEDGEIWNKKWNDMNIWRGNGEIWGDWGYMKQSSACNHEMGMKMGIHEMKMGAQNGDTWNENGDTWNGNGGCMKWKLGCMKWKYGNMKKGGFKWRKMKLHWLETIQNEIRMKWGYVKLRWGHMERKWGFKCKKYELYWKYILKMKWKWNENGGTWWGFKWKKWNIHEIEMNWKWGNLIWNEYCAAWNESWNEIPLGNLTFGEQMKRNDYFKADKKWKESCIDSACW